MSPGAYSYQLSVALPETSAKSVITVQVQMEKERSTKASRSSGPQHKLHLLREAVPNSPAPSSGVLLRGMVGRATKLRLGLTLEGPLAHLHMAMAIFSPNQTVHMPQAGHRAWRSPAPLLQPLPLSVRYGGKGGGHMVLGWAGWEGRGKGVGAEDTFSQCLNTCPRTGSTG
ncbi:hypothetical protein HPG69_005381 [Diceros bicornis minor]|uniref:Uncharacterized protein n=1 Tax=Diceros bicornis minor TaxID=77932 RepID=A0A7J7EMC8_DICBM|nr:hypothetical protein HPG69_005381 [Diceros bicornis minor]